MDLVLLNGPLERTFNFLDIPTGDQVRTLPLARLLSWELIFMPPCSFGSELNRHYESSERRIWPLVP